MSRRPNPATQPSPMAPPQAQAPNSRQNEYFIPRDGIDREVITSDICRYLGNDALVRPGTYEVFHHWTPPLSFPLGAAVSHQANSYSEQDPETRHSISGYFITAYRNLTTVSLSPGTVFGR
ncbi:hypothetical protein IMZ48_15985 [Candidatus Bathyarchaeota archaeon]|nr:hypothetical protein [Candidatus Bathyarchaeota archaeon]